MSRLKIGMVATFLGLFTWPPFGVAQEIPEFGNPISVWEHKSGIKDRILGLIGFVRIHMMRIEYYDTDGNGQPDAARVTVHLRSKGETWTGSTDLVLNENPQLLKHLPGRKPKRPRKTANINRGAPPRSASFSFL